MIEYINSIIRKTVTENNEIRKESFLKQYLNYETGKLRHKLLGLLRLRD